MTVAIPDNLVPISRLTHRLQEFRCVPFSTSMQAGACLANQDSVASEDATPDLKLRRGRCRDCADGRQVRRQLTQKQTQAPPRVEEEDESCSNVSMYLGDCAREMAQETARLERSTSWLARAAWEIARDRIRQIGTVDEIGSDDTSVVPHTDPAPPPARQDDASRCIEPGCDQPPGSIRKNTWQGLEGYCVEHRKKKIDKQRYVEGGRAAFQRQASTPRAKPAATAPTSCAVPGCHEAAARVPDRINVHADLVGLCYQHRKNELQRRWRATQEAAAPVPLATSPLNPSVLAELHGVCVNAGHKDLAIAIGAALAASVRERKAGG